MDLYTEDLHSSKLMAIENRYIDLSASLCNKSTSLITKPAAPNTPRFSTQNLKTKTQNSASLLPFSAPKSLISMRSQEDNQTQGKY